MSITAHSRDAIISATSYSSAPWRDSIRTNRPRSYESKESGQNPQRSAAGLYGRALLIGSKGSPGHHRFDTEAAQLKDEECSDEEASQILEGLCFDLSEHDREWIAEVKPLVMRALMYKKFEDPELRDLLLATGEAEIMEEGLTNTFWGVGMEADDIKIKTLPHRAALNWTGRILQEIRAYLRHGTIPKKDTLILGDNTYASFQNEATPQGSVMLVCCPNATTIFLATLAETLQCPSVRHIVVGMGGRDLLPAPSARNVRPSPQRIVNVMGDVTKMLKGTSTHVTVVPPLGPYNATGDMLDRLVQIYIALEEKFPPRKQQAPNISRYIDMRSVEVPTIPEVLTKEPDMPSAGQSMIMDHIRNYDRSARLHRIGRQAKRILTWEDDALFMKYFCCSCNEYWCVRCFKQSQK